MHIGPLTLLALSSLSFLAEAAPFTPQDGKLQRSRRRLVDYAVQHDRYSNERSLHKRSRPGYSVVLVNGPSDSSSTPAVLPPAAIITTTVTKQLAPETKMIRTTEPAKTKTVIHTSIVTETGTAKTVLVTKVQQVTTTQQITAPAAQASTTVIVTTTEVQNAPAPPPATTTLVETEISRLTLIPFTTSSSFPTMPLWRNSSVPATPTMSSASSISASTASSASVDARNIYFPLRNAENTHERRSLEEMVALGAAEDHNQTEEGDTASAPADYSFGTSTIELDRSIAVSQSEYSNSALEKRRAKRASKLSFDDAKSLNGRPHQRKRTEKGSLLSAAHLLTRTEMKGLDRFTS